MKAVLNLVSSVCFALLPLSALSETQAASELSAATSASWGKVPIYELRGKYWSLESIQRELNPDLLVVVSIKAGCPVQALYLETLQKLSAELKGRRVQFIGVSASLLDTPAALRAFAFDHHVAFPLFKDRDLKLTKALGISRIPEVVVLDRQLRKVYQGSIDDQFSPRHRKFQAERHYLAEAIQSVLQGKPVEVDRTDAQGCEIEDTASETISGLTYSKDIAPLFKTKCVGCHRAGGIQDSRSFQTYEELLPWIKNIKHQVEFGFMPPGSPDPHSIPKGGFANDKSLTPRETRMILSWVAEGAKEGTPAEEQEVQLEADAAAGQHWELEKMLRPGESIAEFDMGTTYRVPKIGIVDYQYFTVPTHFTERKCVRAIEVRPGARKVVHHIEVHLTGPKGLRTSGLGQGMGLGAALSRSKQALDLVKEYPPERRTPALLKDLAMLNQLYGSDQSSEMANYVPGEELRVFPAGMAICVPAGSTITFEVHYTPDGENEYEDRSKVAFLLTDNAPRRVITHPMSKFPLKIPAGESHVVLEQSYTFPEDGEIISLHPHAHKLGKSWRYELEHADGQKQLILSVPNYDYGAQPMYTFRIPLKVTKGTKLNVQAVYDNSLWNPHQTGAPQDVLWGTRTSDEMMNAWLGWSPF